MNSATQNLENDHVYILRLIDVMEKITAADKPVASDLESVVYLIRNYADGLHHAKEENLLFPMLAERGFSLEQGPVAVMLHEHTQGRNFVRGMSDGIEKYKKGDEKAIRTIFENMAGYIDLLRNHIAKENNILFRMSDRVLSGNDNEYLLKEFSKVESGKREEGFLTGYIKEIEKLEETYKVKNRSK
jgi:hemerythrin-like domain-containing protein